MPQNHLLLSIILWLILLFQFVRAVREERLEKTEARKLWAVFFCGCVAYTLGGEQGNLHLTVTNYRFPIGLYAKYFGLLGAFYLYYQILLLIEPAQLLPRRWLRYLAPIAGIVGIIFFMAVTFTDWREIITDEDIHLAAIAFRDAVIIVYILAAFLPANASMWRRERKLTMKLKHVAGLIFFLSLLGSNVGNVLAFFAFSLHVEIIARILPIFSPFIRIAFLSFIVLLLPHKALKYPTKLYLLHRLRKLERRLRVKTGVQSPTPQPTFWMVLPHKLETATYQLVIRIGDQFPHLGERYPNDPTYQRMLALMSADPDYPALVQGLAELHDD